VRRAVSPNYGARANAEAALQELDEAQLAVVPHAADLAILSGHPVGSSQRRALARLHTALWEVFPGHVALLDRDGVVISVNRAWREFGLAHGLGATAALGMNCLDVCDRAAAEGEVEAAEAAEVIRTALAGDVPSRRVDYAGGDETEPRFFRLEAMPIPGRHSGALVVHTDITDDRLRAEQWQHRALHDQLTGLPNRALLCDRLQHAMSGAARDPRSLAVLFVDLDNFKQVNDGYGHGVGDQVLAECARRMDGAVRAADTVGRWGGDEFVVVAERLDDSTTASEVADRLATSLRPPIQVGDDELCLSASIGIAYLDGPLSADDLIQAANQALRAVRTIKRSAVPAEPRA